MKRIGALLLVAATMAIGLATEVAAQAGSEWGVYGGTTANTRSARTNFP